MALSCRIQKVPDPCSNSTSKNIYVANNVWSLAGWLIIYVYAYNAYKSIYLVCQSSILGGHCTKKHLLYFFYFSSSSFIYILFIIQSKDRSFATNDKISFKNIRLKSKIEWVMFFNLCRYVQYNYKQHIIKEYTGIDLFVWNNRNLIKHSTPCGSHDNPWVCVIKYCSEAEAHLTLSRRSGRGVLSLSTHFLKPYVTNDSILGGNVTRV